MADAVEKLVAFSEDVRAVGDNIASVDTVVDGVAYAKAGEPYVTRSYVDASTGETAIARKRDKTDNVAVDVSATEWSIDLSTIPSVRSVTNVVIAEEMLNGEVYVYLRSFDMSYSMVSADHVETLVHYESLSANGDRLDVTAHVGREAQSAHIGRLPGTFYLYRTDGGDPVLTDFVDENLSSMTIAATVTRTVYTETGRPYITPGYVDVRISKAKGMIDAVDKRLSSLEQNGVGGGGSCDCEPPDLSGYATQEQMAATQEQMAATQEQMTGRRGKADMSLYSLDWSGRVECTVDELSHFVEEFRPDFNELNNYWEPRNWSVDGYVAGGVDEGQGDGSATRVSVKVFNASNDAYVGHIIYYREYQKTEGRLVSSDEVAPLRDRTDNIAAADEAQFTEWKFHCDVPEIQAALDANPPKFQYDGGGVWDALINTPLKAGDWWVSEVLPCEGGESSTSLSFPITGYNDVTDAHLSSVIAATRENVIVTKSGEPYVTPTGVKALAPKTGFHVVIPETTDTEVVLKSEGDRANYVAEKVEVEARMAVTSVDVIVGGIRVHYTGYESGEYAQEDKYITRIPVIECDLLEFSVEQISDDRFTNRWSLRTKEEILLKDSDGDLRCTIRAGKQFHVEQETLGSTFENEFNSRIDIDSVWELLDSGNWLDISSLSMESFEEESVGLVQNASGTSERIPSAFIPAPTDHARQFTLSLETDAEEEKDVTWNGGTVIERFPGAKRLAVGRTTWDVKEVAPDVFVVGRVPGADSVSLTGANGNAYTLGVDENGVLEVVKEDE